MKDEIIKKLSDYIGDDTSEDAIALLESVSDALDVSIEDKEREIEELKADIEELKRKYIERFTNPEKIEEIEETEEETEEVIIKEKYEELFA